MPSYEPPHLKPPHHPHHHRRTHRRHHHRLTIGQRRARTVVRAAVSRLGLPYSWGATGPRAFDCSGLVQWAYRRIGYSIPRTTWDQRRVGLHVRIHHVRLADIVFSNNGSHEGLYVGNGVVIEAPHSGAVVRRRPLRDFVSSGYAGIRRYIRRHR